MMLKGYGVGNTPRLLSAVDAGSLCAGMGTRINDVSPTVKLVWMLGEYMHRNYHGRYHSKAQSLRVLLRRAYDDALEKFDVAGDADDPVHGDADPAGRRAAQHRNRRRAEHAGKHLLVRRFRPSRLHRAMRPRQWFAGWPDAGRTPFRGSDIDPAASAIEAGGDWKLTSMIRKSGYRFSERIMLKQKDRAG